jgi:hypothetical protein
VSDLLRRAVTVGPHAGAHRVALRAGISVLVPLMTLVLAGRSDLTVFAAFGAFTSLYGRHHGHVDRTGMQLGAGAAFTLAVGLGVAAAAAPGPHTWVVLVVGALVAVLGQITSDALSWHPPGPLFLVFAFSVCGSLPDQGLADVPLAMLVAAASAAVSIAIGHVGVLRDLTGWRVPSLPALSLRQALAPVGTISRLALLAVTTFVAGLICYLAGLDHPYWGMVAAVAAFGGADHASRVVRGLHRVVGTLAGVAVAGLVLGAHPRGVAAVLVIVVLQIGAELLVGRNYALALLCVTPLALMMSQLAHEQPVGPLLLDRAVSTLVGALLAIGALVVVERMRARRATPLR